MKLEIKLPQNLKNEATWAQIGIISSKLNWIFQLMKYGQLSCIDFYSCYP